MKKAWAKLSELKKLVLLSILVGITITGLCLIGLVSNQPGWAIGAAIGTVIEIPCLILLFKGADYILKKQKTLMFLLFFFLRMLLFAIGLMIPVLVEKYAGIVEFKYGIFGVLIAYTPMQIIAGIVAYKNVKVEGNVEKKDE